MKNGFSLVELSIVLVILGLLTGGILAGQSLIRAAELRAVSTEYQRYVTAVHSFRDKYFQLPGDITNATKFWGTAAAGVPCLTTASTGAETCDGDGDGHISPTTTSNEVFRFWQHLANAGLIQGNYSGVGNPIGTWYAADITNAPSSKLSTGLWWTYYWGENVTNSGSGLIDGYYHNTMMFGAYVSSGWPWGGIMKPEEAWNIDTKMDDGKPGHGKVLGYPYTNCTPATATSETSVDYALTTTTKVCGFAFPGAFR